MNALSHIAKWFIIITLSLSVFSCQNESEEIIIPDDTETINANTKSALLLSRVSLNDGSEDNIIDGASCITIAFPYVVVVNGIELTISNYEDYDRVEDIFDEFQNESDTLTILFPIEVILSDHSKITVENIDHLEELIENCSVEIDDDIECIDIEYPISFSTYDLVTQQATTVFIESDEELYLFLETLTNDDLVNLNYPVNLLLASGEKVIVDNNAELESTIETYEDSCDEDDYDDYYIDNTELNNTLMLNTWIVANYDSSGVYKTDLLNTYEINFLSNYLLNATDELDEYEGEWNTEGSDGILELAMEFDAENQLNLLNKEWQIENYSANQITMRKQDYEYTISVILTIK